MKYFFIFFGLCGIISIIVVMAALFIGVPSNQREVIKIIEIKK